MFVIDLKRQLITLYICIYIKQASAFSLILFSKKYNLISEKKYRDKFTAISRQRVRFTVAEEEEEMGRGNGRFYQRNTCLTSL